MKTLLRSEGVVDLNAAAATSASIFKAPGAGYLDVAASFIRFEEAVAAGGFTTTAGVAALYVGGTEVASWSTGVGAACTGRAIGDVIKVTPATGYEDKPAVFAAGDSIEIKTKTQGVDGTVTGTCRFWTPVEFNLG